MRNFLLLEKPYRSKRRLTASDLFRLVPKSENDLGDSLRLILQEKQAGISTKII